MLMFAFPFNTVISFVFFSSSHSHSRICVSTGDFLEFSLCGLGEFTIGRRGGYSQLIRCPNSSSLSICAGQTAMHSIFGCIE